MKDKETLYARWLSNEITEDERQMLIEDGAIDDLDQIINTLDSYNIPKYDKEEGLKKLKSRLAPKEAKVKTFSMRWAVGIAASFLVLFGLFTFIDQVPQETIFAQNGTEEEVNLMDGSFIKLNDASSISYNNEDWSNDRNIDLKGEAFFQVEKGSPFVVKTKNGSIEVLGTQFNVRAWGANLYVECYEGSVKVNAGKNELILKPGEAINVVDGTMNKKIFINHTEPLWGVGTSRFIDEKMNEVFEEMERQFNVSIKRPNLNQSFSGAFDHVDLNKALESVCKPMGLNYTISEDKKEVVIE